MMSVLKQSKIPILIGFLLLGIDFLTKWIANITLSVESTVDTALPFWNWYLTYNEGYHYIFGELAHFRITQTVGLIAVIVLIWIMARQRADLRAGSAHRVLFGIYISLLIGATGNPWETLVLGRVTDYFIFTPLPWPSNLADQYINLAIYVFMPIWIVLSILESRRKKKAEREELQTSTVEPEESS
ncbi:MAG TPA: signal peptidase II [bacterium]|nr:signal peptidase II [bacterium]